MINNTKIGFAEALGATLIIMLSHLILITPNLIIKSQGSASIINVIFISLIALFLIYLLNLLYKNFIGMDILDISAYIGGAPFKYIVGLIYIIYIIFISSILIRNTAENIRTIYFQSTPTPYIIFFILLTAAFVNRFDLQSVIKCNLIVVPLIIIGLSILFFFSADHFVFQRIFPILGYGTKNIFINGAMNLSMFGNLTILFFIMPILKNTDIFGKISYTSVILSSIFILLTVSALLLMFPTNVSSGSNISLYLQTRLISTGRLVQRIDVFFVIIWLINILSYISIIIGFSKYIFCKICSIENNYRISYTLCCILFGISLIYKDLIQIRKFDTQIYKISSLSVALGLSYLILIIGNLKKHTKKALKGESEIA